MDYEKLLFRTLAVCVTLFVIAALFLISLSAYKEIISDYRTKEELVIENSELRNKVEYLQQLRLKQSQ